MARVLVMIPAGAVYERDCVRWYESTARSIEHYHNIGDAFVYDSSLKLLEYDHVDVLKIADLNLDYIDAINEQYDYVFLRGSNYLHSQMRWWKAAQILPRLDIPIIAFGVGAQAPTDGKPELSDESKRIWRIIADSTESVGVRGAYTADVLWDIGVRNARIIGCPTVFRARDPELRIDLPGFDSVRKVGVTIRREVSPSYSPDVRRYLEVHRELIKSLGTRYDTVLMAQGEVEEKQILFGDDEMRDRAIAALRASNTWTGKWYFDDDIETQYRNRLFYADSVTDYDELVRDQDLVLGFRLHSNLMALANGVPAIYFTYDSRTTEFAETLSIPSFDVHGTNDFELEAYWDQSRFERFNRAYHERYRDMRQFLTENNIAHRLPVQGQRVCPSGEPAGDTAHAAAIAETNS